MNEILRGMRVFNLSDYRNDIVDSNRAKASKKLDAITLLKRCELKDCSLTIQRPMGQWKNNWQTSDETAKEANSMKVRKTK